MRKKQKNNPKKKNQRAYKDFISLVKWCKYDFLLTPHISYIYENDIKKEVEVYRLPIWRELSNVQKLAYFCYFMAETKEFTNLKPFTLDFSKEFRNKYNHLTYEELKPIIMKRMYGNLDYSLKSSNKPMMSFILENKEKRKRKDVKDKETHIHGIIEVFDNDMLAKVRLSLKTSVCKGKKEYKRPEYRTMLKIEKKYNKYGSPGWMWYMNKGACSNNGLYISNSLLDKIRDEYNQLYNEYRECINHLRQNGYKIKFVNFGFINGNGN